MLKKLITVIAIIILSLLLNGCGTGTSIKSEGGKALPAESANTGQDNDTVTIGYIASGATSPQALINSQNSIFADELQKIGKKVKFVSTRSLDNIWPMMDKDKGNLDFVYIPAANFGTYVTETSKFGGSNKYTIIAGSMNFNGTALIARPGINNIKELAGKKVGIANLRYVDEFQLNKVLSTVGLGTTTTGGNVEVVWDDIVTKMIDSFGEGKYDAICLYAAENYPVALGKLPGSKIISNLNPQGLFGDKAPRYWLVAKKDIINNNPELLKTVLKAHVLSTDKAIAEVDKLPAINREVYLKFFREQNAKMDDIIRKNTLESYQKRWQELEITYDPSVSFATDIFSFLDKKGLVKGKTIDDFIQIKFLNETLKEMGKPLVKI